MKRNLRFEMFYPYPPDLVWQALTDSDAIAEWLMPNDFEPKLGHQFTFRTKPAPGFDGIVHCEITVFDPPHRLSYSWQGGGLDTVVIYTLTPEDNGTRLILNHNGFRGVRGVMLSSILGKGWREKILPQGLTAVLKRMSENSGARIAT